MKKSMITFASALFLSGAVNAALMQDSSGPCAANNGVGCAAMTTMSLPTLIVQGKRIAQDSAAYQTTLVREAEAVLRGEPSALVESPEQAEVILKTFK